MPFEGLEKFTKFTCFARKVNRKDFFGQGKRIWEADA
jgi:hypothetical protein